MEPNPLLRILEWFFEGDDTPAKLFLIMALMFIVANLIRWLAR